jgi:D-beta-D-heptose 7-phosphate kinase/D-beta-D-heptose 1-phosphate adenosyltransferase
MKQPGIISQKILTLPDLRKRIEQWKFLGKSIVFTNGCFDILHSGHISSLSAAAREGDMLVVGLNSDLSTAKLKGKGRPVNDEQSRATLLAALLMVDAVVIFEEDTPRDLIVAIQPDVLVKGGDYSVDQVAGAKEVQANGGRVVINPIVEGFSTTAILNKIQKM